MKNPVYIFLRAELTMISLRLFILTCVYISLFSCPIRLMRPEVEQTKGGQWRGGIVCAVQHRAVH